MLRDLLSIPVPSGTLPLPLLHMDGEHVRIHLLDFWADKRPKDFHQAAETCYGTSEGTKLKNHHIPRRSIDNKPVTSEATMSNRPNSVSAGITGLYCLQREIPTSALPRVSCHLR